MGQEGTERRGGGLITRDTWGGEYESVWLGYGELDLGKVSQPCWDLESQGRYTVKKCGTQKRSQAGDRDLRSSLDAWKLCHPGFPNRKAHSQLFHFYCISQFSGSPALGSNNTYI